MRDGYTTYAVVAPTHGLDHRAVAVLPEPLAVCATPHCGAVVVSGHRCRDCQPGVGR